MRQNNTTQSLLVLASLLLTCVAAAFISPQQQQLARQSLQSSTSSVSSRSTTSALSLYHDISSFQDAVTSLSSSSLITATIDSDIAKIPENEFAPVFMGGIIVMFGGLLSALLVGWMIDRRDLYASIVAESYAQGGENSDEEFWKGLSEEEKKKTQELLRRVKESQAGGKAAAESQQQQPSPTVMEPAATVSPKDSTLESSSKASSEAPATAPKKEIGMFSDYGDDA